MVVDAITHERLRRAPPRAGKVAPVEQRKNRAPTDQKALSRHPLQIDGGGQLSRPQGRLGHGKLPRGQLTKTCDGRSAQGIAPLLEQLPGEVLRPQAPTPPWEQFILFDSVQDLIASRKDTAADLGKPKGHLSLLANRFPLSPVDDFLKTPAGGLHPPCPEIPVAQSQKCIL